MTWDSMWEQIFLKNAWGRYPGEDTIRFVARNFYRVADRRQVEILEIGCGPGANLWYMAREGFTVYGVDGSQTAIATCKKRLDSEVPGWSGRVNVGDIGKLDMPDEFVDAVVECEAAYCNDFLTSKTIYREAARVLRPKGKLFVRTFATGCVGDGTGKNVGRNAWLCSEGPLAGKGFSRFTSRDELVELLESFEIESIDLLERSVGGIDSGKVVREFIVEASKR